MENKYFRVSLMALAFLGVAFSNEAYQHFHLKRQQASVDESDSGAVKRKKFIKRTPASAKKSPSQERPVQQVEVAETPISPNSRINDPYIKNDIEIESTTAGSSYVPIGSAFQGSNSRSYNNPSSGHRSGTNTNTATDAKSASGPQYFAGGYPIPPTPNTTPNTIPDETTNRKSFSINSISLKEGLLIVKGADLSHVKSLKIEGQRLTPVSHHSNEIKASGLSGIKLTMGKIFNLIVTDAYGEESYPISIELADGSISKRKLAPLSSAEDGFVLKWDAIGHTWVAAPDEVGSGSGTGGELSITKGAGLVGEGAVLLNSGTIAVNVGNNAGQIPAFNKDKNLVLNKTNKIEFADKFIIGMFDDIFKFRNVETNTTIFEVSGNSFLVHGKSVCLADGTNCPEFEQQDFVSGITIGEGLAPFGTTISSSGIISIADGGVTASKLNKMGANEGDVLKWIGNSWVPAPDNDTSGLSSENDPKVRSFAHFEGVAPEVCADDQTLKFDPILNTLLCSDIVLGSAQVEDAMSDALDDKQDVIDSNTELTVKSIKIQTVGSTWMGFQTQSESENVMWFLPKSDGTIGQVLKTNGAGVLSWGDPDVMTGSITDADIASGAAIKQTKIEGLVDDLLLKEPVISFPNDTTKYWRGDKTWQDLNTTAVSEGTQKYFTEVRVLDTKLTGFTPSSGEVTAADSVLKAIERISGNISNYVLKSGSTMSGDLEMAGNTISGLGTPTDPGDAVTKSYVDSFWTLDSGDIFRGTGRVGIGTNNPMAILDISSTTSGVLIPRMTEIQRNAIPSPGGMQIYNTTTNELNYHNGTSWKALGVAGASITSVTAGTGLSVDTTGTSSTISITSGGVTNTEVASNAGIDRSKLASGSANHILVNNASGFMSSVATLPVSHGGTGISTLTPNRLYVSDNSGSKLEALNCGPLTYLIFDISGAPACSTLPVAASGVSGIVSNTDQAFSGLKTFENGVRVGSNSTVCNSGVEGAIRYNSTSKRMEFCNGASWTNISSGTVASLSIGAPSPSIVAGGAVNYLITYGSGTDSINLNQSMVSLSGTDTSGCTVSVSGAGTTRTVRVQNCTGTGSVGISIAAGSGTSTTGDPSAEAGPSATFQVDNTGPNAPTGVTLGAVPQNLTSTPTISYTAATDVGGSTVAGHEVKIIKTSDSTVVLNWTAHSTGNAVNSLNLSVNTGHTVLIRAKDALGNIGLEASASWTTIDDPCLGTPTPGTVCTGGAIYLGTLASNKYMTTPGGCGEIPAGQKVDTGNGNSSYPSADFTPTCSGTDSLTKFWNNGTSNWFDISGLTNYTTTVGTGNGAINIDANLGDHNTNHIIAITASGQGGYHAAARYCDKLVYGGYSDWYLPNRAELNIMFTNKASIPGLDLTGNWYWSSTEYSSSSAWVQRFSDGSQNNGGKNNAVLVRCVRRY